MQENSTLKIRQLKRKDRVTISKMILKLTRKIGESGILDLMKRPDSVAAKNPPKDAPEATEQNADDAVEAVGAQVFMKLIQLFLENLEDDLAAWFADLAGIPVEELDDQPLDFDMQIIEQLKESPEANRFFSRASRLFSMTAFSRITSKIGSGPQGSISD